MLVEFLWDFILALDSVAALNDIHFLETIKKQELSFINLPIPLKEIASSHGIDTLSMHSTGLFHHPLSSLSPLYSTVQKHKKQSANLVSSSYLLLFRPYCFDGSGASLIDCASRFEILRGGP